MARTKKKELQKVKAEEAKNRRRTKSLDGAPWCNDEASGNTPEVQVKSEIEPDVSSEVKLEKKPLRVAPKTSKQTSLSSYNHHHEEEEIEDMADIKQDLSSLSFHPDSDLLTPTVTPSLTPSVNSESAETLKKIPIRRKPVRLNSSLTSPKRRSPQSKRIKSPKNIFEKFESKTETQEESENSAEVKVSPKNRKTKSQTLSKSPSKSPKSSRDNSPEKKKNPKSLGSGVKPKTSPKRSPKIKEELGIEKKRIRSPKLLTDDMILLPLVDHRKSRTSPKSDKKSDTKKSQKSEEISKTDKTSAIRKLSFTQSSESSNVTGSSLSEGDKKITMVDDCKPSTSSDSISSLNLTNSTQNTTPQLSLNELISRMNNRLKIPQEVINSGKVVKSGLPEETLEKPGNSSDETLPACDSPDVKNLSVKLSESTECLPSCSPNQPSCSSVETEKQTLKDGDEDGIDSGNKDVSQLAIGYEIQTDENKIQSISGSKTPEVLKTKFIGEYTITKPEDDLFPLECDSAFVSEVPNDRTSVEKELPKSSDSDSEIPMIVDSEGEAQNRSKTDEEIEAIDANKSTESCSKSADVEMKNPDDKVEEKVSETKSENICENVEKIETKDEEINMNSDGDLRKTDTKESEPEFGNILCNLLLKGRQTPVDMATKKDKEDDVNFKTSTPKSVSTSNTTTPIKNSPGTSDNSSTEVSPKVRKKQETKEPLPISILSRHETSDDRNSAFFSLGLEKYLAVPTNRFLGLDKNTLATPPSIKLEKQSPELKPEEKNEYECFEPDFDEVDGALFLSFSTEEALQAHIKVETKAKWDKDASTFLGISRMLEVQKHEAQDPPEGSVKEGQTPTHGKLKTLRGQHMRWKKYQRLFHRELTAIFNAEEEEEENIKPQKTNDITKIKGWKLKFKNKLGSHSGKKNKSATVTSLGEHENYWSGHEDDPIVLNSSGSEVEFDEDEVYGPMVVEYTEAMVPPLPEIPQLSRALRKMMIKKLGYDEDDEQVILKLGGRRVIVQKGKDGELEDGEETPKEKKKRKRRKKKDLALAMSETMVEDALRAMEAPETSDKESGVEELPEDLDENIDDNEVVKVQVKAVDLEVKSDGIEVKPFEEEIKLFDQDVKDIDEKVKGIDEKFKDIEIEVKAVAAPVFGLFEESEEEDYKDSTVRNGKTGCDKPGCHFGCICHLCDMAQPLDEPDNQEQTTVCDKEYCRLGCICDSLGRKVMASRTRIPHCGKAKCMLECICDKDKQKDKASEVTSSKGDNSVIDLEANDISASSKKTIDKSKQTKTGKRKKRKSVDDSVVVTIDQDDDPEYKQKMGKKRTERFSNLPKRESTYRVAKNLDAVNRKAMMVYSVSECYSEQRSNRKRKSDIAQPEVVIERDDDEDQIIPVPVPMATRSPTLAIDSREIKQPAKKKSRKQNMEQKSDEFEMSGVEAIKDSVEEAGCELSRLLTMDLPLKKLQELHSKPKGSVLEAVLRNGADSVNKIKLEPNMESGTNFIEESGIKVEKLERQKLLREQLLKEQERYSLISDAQSFIQGTEKGAVSNSAAKNQKSADSKLNEAKKSYARRLECRWHTQMVCLKPHQNASKSHEAKLPEEIKLLEFIANCNWDLSKPQILKRVAQCLRPGLYPTPRQLAVGEFCVEILPQAKKPPVIPPELKSKLPEMMYSIRIKVTLRKDIIQNNKPPQNGATGHTPIRPILAVPIVGKSIANSSSPPVSSSMPTGSISAFSRFQISHPGQTKFKQSNFDTSKKFSLPKPSASTSSSEVVDLTNDEAEVTKNKTSGKKRKKRDKVKDASEPPKKKKSKKLENVIKSDAAQIKNLTSSVNAPTIVGPFELNDLKNLKTSDGKSKLLKLVSPNVMVPANATKDSSKDLIAVPIQIGSHFNPNIPTPLIACPAVPLIDVGENSPLNLSMNNSVSKFSLNDLTSSDDFIIENDICSEEDLDIGTDEFSLSELQDDDSRSSGVSDHNWLKDFQEEDGSTTKKHHHKNLEKIRRQQMRALFIRLKCIVVPDFEPTGAFHVFKEKLLQEATNIITEEEEGSILLSEVLVKERLKHQFLLKKIIDLMEEMVLKVGLSEDTVKEALELRKDHTPARLVARVIDAIQNFSKTRKICEKEEKNSDVFDSSIKNTDTELSSSRNINKSQSVASSSVSDQASSLVANGNSDQVVDLISDSSSSNTSRSNTPIEGIEGVDLDQLPEDEPIDQEFDIDPATNLLRDRNVNQFDCDNEAKNISLQEDNTQILQEQNLPNLQELNAKNNNLQKTFLQDSDFASSTKVKVDPLQICSQESSTIAADVSYEITDPVGSGNSMAEPVHDGNTMTDPVHDGKTVDDPVHDGKTITDPVLDGNSQFNTENFSASTPPSILTEKVSSPCDMLDLIDKSLPGNLELYEDISDGENTSNINSARTDQSNSQNNNFQNGGMEQNQQTTFSNNVPQFQNNVQALQKCMDPLTFQNNSTSFTSCDAAQPAFSTNNNSEDINCETMMSESESSEALFKLNKPPCPLSLIN